MEKICRNGNRQPRERSRGWQTTEQNGKTSHQPYAPKDQQEMMMMSLMMLGYIVLITFTYLNSYFTFCTFSVLSIPLEYSVSGELSNII
jgi:hypothetical protein